MLLTDPEVESSLLISLDEGATYQKYGLAFDILSLLFHPEQEDWILAYSHEQKVSAAVAPFCVPEGKRVHGRRSVRIPGRSRATYLGGEKGRMETKTTAGRT